MPSIVAATTSVLMLVAGLPALSAMLTISRAGAADEHLPSTPFLLGNLSFTSVTARSVLRVPADSTRQVAEPDVVARRLADISPVPLSQVFLLVEFQDSYDVTLLTAICARSQCPGVLVGNCDGSSRAYFTWMATPGPSVPCVAITSTVTARVLDFVSNATTGSFVVTPEGADPGWEVLRGSTWLMAIAAALYLALALFAVFKGISFTIDGACRLLKFSDVPKAELYIVCLHFASATVDFLTFLNFAAFDSRGFSYRTQVLLSELSNPLNMASTVTLAILLREAAQVGTQTVRQRLSRMIMYSVAVVLLVASLVVFVAEFVTLRRSAGDSLTAGLATINSLCATVYFTCFGYATAKRLLRMKGALPEEHIQRRRRFALRLAHSGLWGFVTVLGMIGILATTASNGSFATFWMLYGLIATSSAITRALELSAFAPIGQQCMLARVQGFRVYFRTRPSPRWAPSNTVCVQPSSRHMAGALPT
ncbi:Intimal thickness related receptor IRP domain-containing protein [Plasmodiophora brassicae]|uniref:Intimal thickness related receptor IRP domain-containing protein n=1 Tax=Plasmodiophora brassicae TaxID=37360 RepID=A0A0G4IRV9_PLABS|nr:hypothetical protein PBRA_006003 [Plasmodiophora brassicae]SPQ98104.1 unnamed protein product [Plasmodiophora brassicae]